LVARADEFLRVGQHNDVGPGMVCLLAISIPAGLPDAESRLVHMQQPGRRAVSRSRFMENDSGTRFLPSAM